MEKNYSSKKLFLSILVISSLAIAFLIWLIYFQSSSIVNESSIAMKYISLLPTFNAILNGLSAISLVCGFIFIKKGLLKKHQIAMTTAFAFSSLFLVGYIVYHYYVGDTKFINPSPIKYLYFFILISHILLSIINLPMILATFSFAILKDFNRHKKLARWTFPIWLYVSLTGVLVFIFLKFFNHP